MSDNKRYLLCVVVDLPTLRAARCGEKDTLMGMMDHCTEAEFDADQEKAILEGDPDTSMVIADAAYRAVENFHRNIR